LTVIRRLVPFRARVAIFCAARSARDRLSRQRFACKQGAEAAAFPHLVFSHRARLVRDYPEPWYSLQQNKIANLRIAADQINGVTIAPGESFSFWRLVGRTSCRKGYLAGMTIADGRLNASLGGGLCQLSNALYWLALHLGCTVSERHRHSFDCFPDSHRTVPFGAGATVYYNYVDLRFRNDGEETFLLVIWLDDEYLQLEAFADRKPRHRYRVIEENHHFTADGQARWRENDLYLLRLRGDEVIGREHLAHNKGRVLYDNTERWSPLP